MTIPVWPFAPDWTNPILETYEWKTSILTSRVGAEQRMSQRASPRRIFDYPVQLYANERTLFDLWVMQNGGHQWWVPVPSESLLCHYSLAAGDTFVPFDTAFRDASFLPGVNVALQSSSFVTELVEIISVSPNGIQVTPLVKSYTSGCIVAPAILCQIVDTVTAARRTGAVFTATVRFQSAQANPRRDPPPRITFPYRGYPILLTKPNSINDIEYAYERPMMVVDNGAAIPRYSDPRGYATPTQRFEFFLYGREERRDFIDFLYAMQGQLAPIWVPTFNDDLAPGQGWTDPEGLLGSVPMRDTAIEFMRDGSFNIRQATSGGTAEHKLFTQDDNPIIQTSFMTLKRLGVDSIEISNYAGLEGVATASVLFRDAPDIRVAGTYYKNPFTVPIDFPPSQAASVNPPLDLAHAVTVDGEPTYTAPGQPAPTPAPAPAPAPTPAPQPSNPQDGGFIL